MNAHWVGLSVGWTLIAVITGTPNSGGEETELDDVTAGSCLPSTSVTRYSNGTLGGHVTSTTITSATPMRCIIRIPLDNPTRRRKRVTLYTEFFDTANIMVWLEIKDHRFYGSGDNPNAMQVGQTYEYYTSSTTFDLHFNADDYTFSKQGISLRYLISDVTPNSGGEETELDDVTAGKVILSRELNTSPAIRVSALLVSVPPMSTSPEQKPSPRVTKSTERNTSPFVLTSPGLKTSPRQTRPPVQETTPEPNDSTKSRTNLRVTTTASSDLSNGDAVQLSCDSRRMTVVVDVERFAFRFPDVDPTSLALRDAGCRVKVDGARLVWSFSLDECQTGRYELPDDIAYTNQLISVPQPHPLLIREASHWCLNITCMLSRDATVKDGYGLIERRGYTKVGRGDFILFMDLFRDLLMAEQIEQFPAPVRLRDRLYVRTSVNSSDTNLTLALQACVAMPTLDAPPDRQYGLINHRCPRDDNVEIYPVSSSGAANATFSFRAFRFDGAKSTVYIRCHVIVCDNGSREEHCSQQCSNGRERRSLGDEESMLKVFQGPLIIDVEDPTDAAFILSSAPKTRPVRNMTAVILLSAGGAALVIGVVLVSFRYTKHVNAPVSVMVI